MTFWQFRKFRKFRDPKSVINYVCMISQFCLTRGKRDRRFMTSSPPLLWDLLAPPP